MKMCYLVFCGLIAVLVLGCSTQKKECKKMTTVMEKVDNVIVEVRETKFFQSNPKSLREIGNRFSKLQKEMKGIPVKTDSLKEAHGNAVQKIDHFASLFMQAAQDVERRNQVGVERAGHMLKGAISMWKRATLDIAKVCK